MALEDGNLQRDISLSPRCAQAAGDATPRAAHVKELSRRQLKDLLADVFASKTRADARWYMTIQVNAFMLASLHVAREEARAEHTVSSHSHCLWQSSACLGSTANAESTL